MTKITVQEQPEQQKEDTETDSVELSVQAKAKIDDAKENLQKNSIINLEENKDEPGRNIDFKA